MSANERLRTLLDERGVKWKAWDGGVHPITVWHDETYLYEFVEYRLINDAKQVSDCPSDNDGHCELTIKAYNCTTEQAIAATLGTGLWVNPTWERWHKSLRHDEIKSIGDAVEQLMYEAIEFGGDMGPNGNTYNGIDEGDVLTSGFIKDWIARFESTLGRDRYTYGQYREISNAVGDAMEYAHDRAIEHPDKADPFWNLDEYVSRILKVAFEGEATQERRTCHVMTIGEFNGEATEYYDYCSNCGYEFDDDPLNYCPNCGRRISDATSTKPEPARTELLPCPLCGGDANLVSDYSSERDETRWNVWHDCDGFEGESSGYGYLLHPWFETPWYKDMQTAIAAWNRRAE